MAYGFNSVDDISRAIMHSGGMKDKGVPMCEVNARLIYDEIKDLKQHLDLSKKREAKLVKSSKKGIQEKVRIIMELREDNEKFQKEIKDLKQEIILLNCNISSEKLARAPRLWKEMKEENEKLKKENESITSHRDRLLRKMRRQRKAAQEWDEGTNHLAIQILNQSQELKLLKNENKELKNENQRLRLPWKLGC